MSYFFQQLQAEGIKWAFCGYISVVSLNKYEFVMYFF